ncbi:hypothetical protein PM023_16075 [Halorubrum ezzemoulense]|nr:hypothetical protein [Halorubrum ezzemoulense]MDB2226164.1 hypothetical protein [Halorubrum ezzemoulense]
MTDDTAQFGDGLAHPDTHPVAAPDARWAAAPAAGLGGAIVRESL